VAFLCRRYKDKKFFTLFKKMTSQGYKDSFGGYGFDVLTAGVIILL
jgi:hypothetical protein